MNKQYVRQPMVSDAPGELQMSWASYLKTHSDPLPFDVWNARRLGKTAETTK